MKGFFYNPNIHPFGEYKARQAAVEQYSLGEAAGVEYPGYLPEEFFRAVNLKEEKPRRCLVCWDQRLRVTAQAAKKGGFTHFTSTLLVSPYQDQEALKKIGCDIAADEGIEFYYEDFRPGFRPAHDQAKARGVYCQKYCGCIYSEIERYDTIQVKREKLRSKSKEARVKDK